MKYYQQLLEEIEKGEIAPVNLFYGPESFLREKAIYKFKEALINPDMAGFNFEMLDGMEVSGEEIASVSSAPPMMGEKRLIVVKRAPFFKSGGRGAEEANVAPVLNYINAPAKTTCLIMETGESVDRRKKIYKAAASKGKVVEFTRLKNADLARWINSLARRGGKKISRRGIEMILSRCGREMFDIYNEMNKLIDYTGTEETIKEEYVDFVVAGRGEENIFAVVDALGNMDYGSALEGIQNLLRRKESPQVITTMLARQVRLMIQARELSEKGYTPKEACKYMGVPGFVYNKALSQGKNFTVEQLVSLLKGIAGIDEQVKTGKQEFYPSVEMLFLDFHYFKEVR